MAVSDRLSHRLCSAYIVQAKLACMSSYTQPESHSDHQRRSAERDTGKDWHPCPSNGVDIIGLWPGEHIRWR
jgi:hypothetical protein